MIMDVIVACMSVLFVIMIMSNLLLMIVMNIELDSSFNIVICDWLLNAYFLLMRMIMMRVIMVRMIVMRMIVMVMMMPIVAMIFTSLN